MLSTTSKTPTAIPQDVKCVVERLLKTKRTLPPVPATTRVGNDLGDAASGIAFSTGPREEAESSSFGKRAEFAVYGWGINEAWTDSESEGDGDVQDIQFLAEGGYNRLWTVTTSFGSTTKKFILRMPMEDALLPHQLLNEVAFLAYVASNLPRIPVPRVYAFDAGTSLVGVPFIAEEFVEGVRLDEAWSGYDDREKDIVARRLAEMVVDMATTTFPGIGGLTLQHELGPTVEGMKLFGGRVGSPQNDMKEKPLTDASCRTNSIRRIAIISDRTSRRRSTLSPATRRKSTTTPTLRNVKLTTTSSRTRLSRILFRPCAKLETR